MLIQKSLVAVIDALIDFIKIESLAFACWKTPNDNIFKLMIDFDCGRKFENTLLEKTPGYIIAPFDRKKNSLLLNNDMFIIFNRQAEIINNKKKNDHFINFINTHQQLDTEIKNNYLNKYNTDNDYIKLVEKSIKKIKNGCFTKIVPSRCRKVKLKQRISIGNLFFNVSQKYPSSYASIIYTPTNGLWVGATPELLLETKNSIFRTVSLAATQKKEDNVNLNEVSWTQKEIEEQALVSRYIIDCFKKIRLREFKENGPKNIIAGNLIHLITEFYVNMNKKTHQNLAVKMLHLLHPTSAVCGMPSKPSKKFLEKNELYDRELFCGYHGYNNINNETALYVNIRCMKIEKDYLKLYAGAGITEHSDPYKEWLETELKMKTLLDVITEN